MTLPGDYCAPCPKAAFDTDETLHLEGCTLPGDHPGPCDRPTAEDYALLDAWLVKAKRRGGKGWATFMYKREQEALSRVLAKI